MKRTVALKMGVLLAHQMAISHGPRGVELRVQRHAPHGTVENPHADIQNPLWPTRWPPDLQSHEPHSDLHGLVVVLVVRLVKVRDEITNEDTDGAHVDISEPVEGVNLNHDCGGVGVEERVVDAEDELVVPGGVVISLRVHPGRKFPVLMDPRHSVRPHGTRYICEVLCRYEIEFQELERC